MVVLKSGGMLRGTISELVPGGNVTIVTLTGATKVVPMTDVQYAGPADKGAPPPSRPQGSEALVNGPPVPIRFFSNQPLTLFLRPVGLGYTPVCTAPCTATLAAGTHQFALSLDSNRPVALGNVTALDGRSRLEGSYDSHKGRRQAGWGLFGSSLGIGTLLFIAGVLSKANTGCSAVAGGSTTGQSSVTTYSCTTGAGGDLLMIAGGATGLIGATAGLLLALKFDEVSLTVTRE